MNPPAEPLPNPASSDLPPAHPADENSLPPSSAFIHVPFLKRVCQSRARLGIPLGLLILCLVVYAPLTPFLGLYWDDWPSLWFLHFFGPGIFPAAFAIDRPVQGWLFVLTTGLIGESVLAWHWFAILARWLSGMALLWLLSSVWPRHKTQAVWAVTLFLVYPGFLQQYIPITYSHQFLIQASYFIGLALMVRAVRRPARYWRLTALSVLVSLLSMFALEYFYGLVLLRPVLIWLALSASSFQISASSLQASRVQSHPPRPQPTISHTLLLWLPYLLADVLFLAWRVTHSTPRGAIVIFDRLAADPAGALLSLAQTIAIDLYESSLLAWVRTLSYLNTSGMKTLLAAGYWVAILAAGLLTFFFLRNLYNSARTASFKNQVSSTLINTHPFPTSTSSPSASIRVHPRPIPARHWGMITALIGLYTLLISGWPIWVTDLHLELAFPWDRFTLLMMLGVSLLLVGLLEWLVRPPLLKIALLSLLVGLAAGAQFREALLYRLDWMVQKDFLWQLAWRVPALQSGTLVLYPNSQFQRVTDNSLSAPLNWLYAPQLASRQMPYLMYDPLGRLGNKLPELKPGFPVRQNYRATDFTGSTSQALVLFYEPPRCLKVLDPTRDANLPNKPDIVLEALPLSRPELILPAAAPPTGMLTSLFGPEPEHGWCYDFQNAELAVQRGDWERAARLGDQALRIKPEPGREQAAELVPFIEGYAHLGRWQDAWRLSQSAARASEKMSPTLCDLWYRIAQSTPATAERLAVLEQVQQKLNCELP